MSYSNLEKREPNLEFGAVYRLQNLSSERQTVIVLKDNQDNGGLVQVIPRLSAFTHRSISFVMNGCDWHADVAHVFSVFPDALRDYEGNITRSKAQDIRNSLRLIYDNANLIGKKISIPHYAIVGDNHDYHDLAIAISNDRCNKETKQVQILPLELLGSDHSGVNSLSIEGNYYRPVPAGIITMDQDLLTAQGVINKERRSLIRSIITTHFQLGLSAMVAPRPTQAAPPGPSNPLCF